MGVLWKKNYPPVRGFYSGFRFDMGWRFSWTLERFGVQGFVGVPYFNPFFLKGNHYEKNVYTFSPWLLKSPGSGVHSCRFATMGIRIRR